MFPYSYCIDIQLDTRAEQNVILYMHNSYKEKEVQYLLPIFFLNLQLRKIFWHEKQHNSDIVINKNIILNTNKQWTRHLEI